jgi:hypothetical protein
VQTRRVKRLKARSGKATKVASGTVTQLVQLHWVKSLNQRLPKPSLRAAHTVARCLIFDTKVRAFWRRYEKLRGKALGFPPGLLLDGLR